MADVKVGNKTVSQEDVEKALQLLENQKAMRAKQREKMADPAVKAKLAVSYQRNRAKNTLLLQKAIAAGITVSDKEIDAAIAKLAAAPAK